MVARRRGDGGPREVSALLALGGELLGQEAQRPGAGDEHVADQDDPEREAGEADGVRVERVRDAADGGDQRSARPSHRRWRTRASGSPRGATARARGRGGRRRRGSRSARRSTPWRHSPGRRRRGDPQRWGGAGRTWVSGPHPSEGWTAAGSSASAGRSSVTSPGPAAKDGALAGADEARRHAEPAGRREVGVEVVADHQRVGRGDPAGPQRGAVDVPARLADDSRAAAGRVLEPAHVAAGVEAGPGRGRPPAVALHRDERRAIEQRAEGLLEARVREALVRPAEADDAPPRRRARRAGRRRTRPPRPARRGAARGGARDGDAGARPSPRRRSRSRRRGTRTRSRRAAPRSPRGACRWCS